MINTILSIIGIIAILLIILLTSNIWKLRTRIEFEGIHDTPVGISFEWWKQNIPDENGFHDSGKILFLFRFRKIR